jgi:hypothetical protein
MMKNSLLIIVMLLAQMAIGQESEKKQEYTNSHCEKIVRKSDDFTNEIQINSPIIETGQIASMIIYKILESGDVMFFLSLQTYGNTLNVGETGVILLFDDGTKMNKPSEEIDVDAHAKGFKYSAFISLTETEVISLSTKKIKKFRLYIYDEAVNPDFADKFTHYVKCVLDKE